MKTIKTVFVFSLVNLVIIVSAITYLKLNKIDNRDKGGTKEITPVYNMPTQEAATQASPKKQKCIVTVDKIRYDLTEFVSLHSGGDIFSCGTDMSESFHKQHPNNYLDVLAKYKI